MKTKNIFAAFAVLSILLSASIIHADDITAVQNGYWSDTNIWSSGTVPYTNDDVDIPSGINVTVDSNQTVQFIYDAGTVTMTPDSTLEIITDSSIAPETTFDATAVSNTVIYSANVYFAKLTDYYNLVLSGVGAFYNGDRVDVGTSATTITIAGNLTLAGAANLQQGTNITIDGDLTIGSGLYYDASLAPVTVKGNTLVNGFLLDGSGDTTNLDDSFNNITIGSGGLWKLSDVIEWVVNGNLTNNGTITYKKGPTTGGSITFNGTGVIAGNPFTVWNLVLNGTNTIATTVTATNFLGLNGTVVFDLANPQKLILSSMSTNTLTYVGDLDVINTGAAPTSGTTYQLFSAPTNAGAFTTINLPPLPSGLSWVTNLTTSGSITVTGTATGSSPMITSSQYNAATHQFTLTWTSVSGAMYTVQETPSLSPVAWSALQTNISSGGSTTTTTVTMPNDTKGFIRILVQ